MTHVIHVIHIQDDLSVQEYVSPIRESYSSSFPAYARGPQRNARTRDVPNLGSIHFLFVIIMINKLSFSF